VRISLADEKKHAERDRREVCPAGGGAFSQFLAMPSLRVGMAVSLRLGPVLVSPGTGSDDCIIFGIAHNGLRSIQRRLD
jgi:hypothetical protein